MNLINALIFATFGSIMELLPKVFPAWFPPSGADQANARALWISVMGIVQIALGLGFIVRARIFPVVYKAFAASRSETGTLGLPSARGVTTR